jgi:sugar/nucleoside kinase (ribokinase family)
VAGLSKASPRFGLIGTISRDEIAYPDGRSFHQLGGILYQAAVLCGLGEETALFANLSDDLAPDFEDVISSWPTLKRHGIKRVPGPGNLVHLIYPDHGERREVLESTVPALDPALFSKSLLGLDLLVMVVNSGFDMALGDWRKIADAAPCPIWFDIHSLTLKKVLGVQRDYRAIPEWKEWARGATYLQANRQEVACMLGRPDSRATDAEVDRFGREALDGLGPGAVFVTLGKEGAMVTVPGRSERIGLSDTGQPVDTTGCGDAFCAAAVARLARGASPAEATTFGVSFASRVAMVSGVEKTYELALNEKQ